MHGLECRCGCLHVESWAPGWGGSLVLDNLDAQITWDRLAEASCHRGASVGHGLSLDPQDTAWSPLDTLYKDSVLCIHGWMYGWMDVWMDERAIYTTPHASNCTVRFSEGIWQNSLVHALLIASCRHDTWSRILWDVARCREMVRKGVPLKKV